MDSTLTRTALEIVAFLRSHGVTITFDGEHGRLSNVKDPSILTPQMRDDMRLLRWEIIEVLPWQKNGHLICGAHHLGAHADNHSFDEERGELVCDICWPKQYRPRKLELDIY